MIEVQCVDVMGTDLSVVNSARVSFNKQSDWKEYCDVDKYGNTIACEYDLSVRDRRLLNYLARNGHFTPFTHTAITLHVKAPIFVRTQCFKSKIGLTENEVSRRYVKDEPTFYYPDVWRTAPDNAKQGSGDGAVEELPYGRKIDEAYEHVIDQCHSLYISMLEAGVAPEQARMVLPQAMMTEWWWTGSVAAFARVYNLRADLHAQYEVQLVAKEIDEIIRPLFPNAWSALTKENE